MTTLENCIVGVGILLMLLILALPSNGTTLEEVPVTYTKDIRPIFSKNCMSCHNAKSGLGNWQDYKQAYDKRFEIKSRVESREMPMHGGTRISESEREDIVLWVNTGAVK